MSRRGLVINTLVALIAILITGGLAAQAVIRDPSSASDSKLVAAGVDGRDAFAIESPGSTAATRPTASTRPQPRPTTARTAPSTVPVTVPPAPDTTLAPAPITTVAPPIAPPPFVPPNLPPDPNPPAPVPTTVQTSPSSWRMVDNGVTVTARIEPAEPRVGDTVTISYTTTGEGDFCCWAFVYADGVAIGENRMPQGSTCPVAPLTEGSASVVMAEAGPFTFQVQASRNEHVCSLQMTFLTANLFGTFPVLPAA